MFVMVSCFSSTLDLKFVWSGFCISRNTTPDGLRCQSREQKSGMVVVLQKGRFYFEATVTDVLAGQHSRWASKHSIACFMKCHCIIQENDGSSVIMQRDYLWAEAKHSFCSVLYCALGNLVRICSMYDLILCCSRFRSCMAWVSLHYASGSQPMVGIPLG